jgi:hypothetical protein
MVFLIISHGIVFYSNYKLIQVDEMGCRFIVRMKHCSVPTLRLCCMKSHCVSVACIMDPVRCPYLFFNLYLQSHMKSFCFLVAFAKLREATLGFFMSVRPSVRMEQLSTHWRVLMKFDIRKFLKNLSIKFKFC